ncbi:MAG: hypothetical protein LUO94_03115 [Methylococcaceae bacterium]|nr:hypothetical protein [Methylococcaceae bacterium]MDD1630637.1 hypothetical protein [Methylococcaceae bacterium]MDD1643247.1 hypothetical protein [Methylococcaceae bacterium]
MSRLKTLITEHLFIDFAFSGKLNDLPYPKKYHRMGEAIGWPFMFPYINTNGVPTALTA